MKFAQLGVGQEDAHDGDGKKAGLVDDLVRNDKDDDDERQHHDVAQIVRHQVAAQQFVGDVSGQESQPGADRCQHDKGEEGVLPGVTRARDNQLEGDDGDRCADGVDDDPLPAQNRPDIGRRPYVAQDRRDDGRTGDDNERAEEQRQRPRQPYNVVRRGCTAEPGHGCTDREQVANRSGDVAHFVPTQRQRAFKEDDGN